VQVSLAAEVAVNYIELRGLQQRLAIARSNLASQQETLQITQWRLQAGLTTSLVAEQARAAAEQTAAQMPALQAAWPSRATALAVLTGQPPAALDAALADAPRAVPQRRDDLALGHSRRNAAPAPDVRAGRGSALPRRWRACRRPMPRATPAFRISGNLGLRAADAGGADTAGCQSPARLLAGISVPLFDGGAARAQVRVQEAALEQVRMATRPRCCTALKDVEDALVALQGDRERLVRLQAAADAAANAACWRSSATQRPD
jgi:multidrug efflux system outer membrane protein